MKTVRTCSCVTLCLLFLAASVCLAADRPPIEVIIIGVPSTGVKAYQDSDLGAEITKACADLQQVFSGGGADVIDLCTADQTTSSNVHDTLKAHFQTAVRGRVTLLFIMAHGEPSPNDDVRLLMSDTTDDTKAVQSLLLRTEVAPLLTEAVDSVAVGFVDACFSGAAHSYRLSSLGSGGEMEGVHAGLLASAQAYQQSTNLSFTKALIDIWRSRGCSSNPDDFISMVLDKIGQGGSSPIWLVTYHGSSCFGDLLAPDKRLVSIWRDSRKNVRVLLYELKNDHETLLRAIPPGPEIVMPYMHAVPPGTYHVETRDEQDNQALLDQMFCDFTTAPYCDYSYPITADGNTIASFNNTIESYRAAEILGYDSKRLQIISSSAAADYQDLLQALPGNEEVKKAVRLAQSSPLLWSVLTTRQQSSASDTQMASKVSKAIKQDDATDTAAQNVQVTSKNGVVTLKGRVRSEAEKAAIEGKAKQLVGAGNVNNQITVIRAK